MPSFFLAEDHSLTKRGVRDFLVSKGFVCLGTAQNAEETLKQFTSLADRNSLPDILVLDLFLNGESGLDVLKQISASYPYVKTVVYSMYEHAGVVALSVEYGAKGYVCKSGSEEELLKAVDTVLAGGTYIAPTLVSPLLVYHNLLASLTKRESSILKKVIEHKSNEKIADELRISVRTVENYLSKVYEKTGCKNHESLIARFA